jgi:hypothetical protein
MVLNKLLSTVFPIQKSHAFKALLLLTRADRVLKVLEGEVHETSFSQLLGELDGSL